MAFSRKHAGALALLCAATLVATAQSADARKRKRRYNPEKARAPLVMTSFVENGRTDVFRNQRLTFKFSSYLRKASVDDRTVRVAAVTPTGVKPANGALVVRGSKVEFDPTRSQRNFDDSKNSSLVNEGDNPEGFASFQDYTVEIPGPPDLHTVRNLRRHQILQGFSGSFRTAEAYLDPVVGQPAFVGEGGTGVLGFEPPRSGTTGLVDEDAVIVLEFSEPIEVNSLDPSDTVLVDRVGVGRVPGFVKKDPNFPNGRRFLFVPSLGFGSNELQQSGWDVVVTLVDRLRDVDGNVVANGITDLAGNPLKRPVTFSPFRTRYVQGKPSASIIVESFDDQSKMDPITPTEGGEWNTLREGVLLGGAPTAFPPQEVQYTSATVGSTIVRTRLTEPLVAESIPATNGGGCFAVPQGSRTQMLYVPSDVGLEAAITHVGWGPSSNAIFAAFYPGVVLRMGHTSVNALGSDFAANYTIGNPLTVFTGDYSVPQAANIKPPGLETGYWNWPDLVTPFEYNGVDNLIFDAAAGGGNNCQILRVGFSPGGGAFPFRSARSRNATSDTAEFALDTLVYDISYQKRRRTTRATSSWYGVPAVTPLYAQPIVSPVGQPGGVQVFMEVEGAPGKADPFNPGVFVPNTALATGWTSDVTEIEGYQFFRFRIVMIANLTTNRTAEVRSLQFPFQF